MKKEDIKDYSSAVDFCFLQAQKNIIKNLTLDDEDLEFLKDEEYSIHKRFSKMHPNLNAENWKLIKKDTPLFTRRIEYLLCGYFI